MLNFFTTKRIKEKTPRNSRSLKAFIKEFLAFLFSSNFVRNDPSNDYGDYRYYDVSPCHVGNCSCAYPTDQNSHYIKKIKEAGFNDVSAYNIRSKWPPFYLNIYGFFGLGFFKLVCYFWALMNNNYQIKVVAKK